MTYDIDKLDMTDFYVIAKAIDAFLKADITELFEDKTTNQRYYPVERLREIMSYHYQTPYNLEKISSDLMYDYEMIATGAMQASEDKTEATMDFLSLLSASADNLRRRSHNLSLHELFYFITVDSLYKLRYEIGDENTEWELKKIEEFICEFNLYTQRAYIKEVKALTIGEIFSCVRSAYAQLPEAEYFGTGITYEACQNLVKLAAETLKMILVITFANINTKYYSYCSMLAFDEYLLSDADFEDYISNAQN